MRKQNDDDGGKQYFKSVSRYNIKNAFLERLMPLSDNVHGPFRMMPPELLHTSGSGLIMYMFKSLNLQHYDCGNSSCLIFFKIIGVKFEGLVMSVVSVQ
jgi:hypothetical protein